jgi:hypothetical protein
LLTLPNAGDTNWSAKMNTAVSDAAAGKQQGVVSLESFANNTGTAAAGAAAWNAAVTYCRAQTYPQTIRFSSGSWDLSTVTTTSLNWNGAGFIGPPSRGREYREHTVIKCPSTGLFAFSNGKRDFSFRDLEFQATGGGVWMQSFATDASAGHWDDIDIESCGFQGFSSVITGTVLRLRIANVYVNGATGTQFSLGGSDSSLFMDGMNFMSGTLSSSTPFVSIGMSSTNIGPLYVTPQGGYGLQIFYTAGGLTVHGYKSDATGRSGATATQLAGIQQTSGVSSSRTVIYRDVWVFNAGQAGTSKGLIEIKGGNAVFYSPNFPGSMTGTTPAVTNIPGIYVANGASARVHSPLADNSGYKHLAKQASGSIFCDDASWTIDTVA